ncbi:MAG: acetolactate synthase small subunit [Spartobacteria bacterium]|nr:acetolactate synthase small subunit [Spartobacteria bacterium]
MKKHIFSVLVENHFGVLARVANLFSARGYNISSLTVGETEDPSISRMTIVAVGDDSILEQIAKQLNKLIDVIKVRDITHRQHVERELVLMKINAPKATRADIIQAVDVFKGTIVSMTRDELGVELSGDSDKMDAFIEYIRPFGIKEMVRSGKIVMAR